THASDVAVMRRLGPVGTGVVRRVTRRAAAVTAVSRQTAAKLLAFFDGTEREALERAIAVAPMGIDAQPDDQPNAHPDNPAARAGSHHTVAVIARLVEKKGIHVLLEAWPDVLATVPDARLLIGGDGPWRERLERQASGLAGVEFHGYVTGPAKVALEAQATLVAVPSVVAADGDSDGLPVAALEAWGRGAFVVASDASGAHELLEGAGIGEGTGVDSGAAPDPRSAAGVVVPAGDAAALASAIIDAMTRGEPARRRSAAAGRALAHSLTWQALAPAMLERLRAAARVGGWRP
ncbi:MAG: glycosyltransferase, partial [Demequina sp.]